MQLSASSVTTETSGAGTSEIHSTVIFAGLLAVGGTLSSTVTVAVQLDELPLSSVTVNVTVLSPISLQSKFV